jgi:UPF0716 protein FxsA
MVMLLAYPFIEIFGCILLIRLVGFSTTFFLFITTTILGFYVLKKVKTEARQINPFRFEQNKNIVRIVAGLLLILPGFFTDILGLFLLCPPIQRMIRHRLFKMSSNNHAQPAAQQQKGRIIEGEYWRDEP